MKLVPSIFTSVILLIPSLKIDAAARQGNILSPAQHAVSAYAKLPLHFEANRGQTDRQVKYLARGASYALFLTNRDVVLALNKPEQMAIRKLQNPRHVTAAVVRMTFLGASTHPHMLGLEKLPGTVNYLIGNNPETWRTNVPTFAKIQYHNIYPGIDVNYYGSQQQLEYDLIVRPGSDPKKIILAFSGADRLEVNAEGDLVLHTALGAIRQAKPIVYQEIGGVRRPVTSRYLLKNGHQVCFDLHDYDATKPLVIDPALFYSTYLGGSNFDVGQAIAVDPAGDAYITGTTESSNFPTTVGAFQTTPSSLNMVFVAKLNPTGSALVYSTYLGGTSDNFAESIAVDTAGEVFLTGTTHSTDFPTTHGALQTTSPVGNGTGFVTKLNANGSALVYSTYLGGSTLDVPAAIAGDAAGNAYVAGLTQSPDFPTTLGAFQPNFAGGVFDAFVAKLNPTGTGLIYSTYLGGSSLDFATGIAIDSAGDAFVTGVTSSTDLLITPGAFQTTLRGSRNTFVTELDPTGGATIYLTYLGGSGDDEGEGIAIDASGQAYVTGGTTSTDFPTTPGAFQPTLAGVQNAFVTKLSSVGSALVYSTYLGGSNGDAADGIAVDSAGNSYVTGITSSTDFPTTPEAFQTTLGGSIDAFVTALNPAGGSPLVFSTYLGGSANDNGVAIALDSLPIPNVYVTGFSGSTDFPTTSGAFQPTFGGGKNDAFVVKIINIVMPPPITVGKVTGGGTVNVVGGIANFGFIVQRQAADDSIKGDLQYRNHSSGAKVHSVMFTSFSISGTTSTFGGTCTNNGEPCTFTVTVQDNDQSGGSDSMIISINGGTPEGGMLVGGNIAIHQ